MRALRSIRVRRPMRELTEEEREFRAVMAAEIYAAGWRYSGDGIEDAYAPPDALHQKIGLDEAHARVVRERKAKA